MKVSLPVRKAIRAAQSSEAPYEDRLHKVRLDFNENTVGCSPSVVRALARLSPKRLAMYPEYQPYVREFARFFAVRSNELFLTNGADDALRLLFDVFVDPGSSVLFCEPTFPMYRFYAGTFAANVLGCRYDRAMAFPMPEVLRALSKKPRLLFVANPNNPTGTLLASRQIEELLRAATHTAVVIDEAYVEFSGVTVLPLIRTYPQLFVVRTFSKAAGLAGLRLGAIAAREDSLDNVRRAAPPFPVNLAALVAALAAIHDGRTLRNYVRDVKRLRHWLDRKLNAVGVATYPSAGNFLLANFGPKGAHLFARLAEKGFLLRERTRELGPGFVRISIGTEAEMRRLIKAIRRLM